MFFEINSERRERMILIDLTTSFLSLTEIGDIEVESSERVKHVQKYDRANEHRNVCGNESHMHEVWNQCNEKTGEETAGNLHSECVRIDIEFHHSRNNKSMIKQINSSWINASSLLPKRAPLSHHYSSLAVASDQTLAVLHTQRSKDLRCVRSPKELRWTTDQEMMVRREMSARSCLVRCCWARCRRRVDGWMARRWSFSVEMHGDSKK